MSAQELAHDAQPSDWVARWLPEPTGPGRALDFACGAGRHAKLAAERGFEVLALDRNPACLVLNEVPGIEARVVDLESTAWDFCSERFAVIVVSRYLFRPRLDMLLGLLADGGCLIYETFAAGHARYGRPANPAFLLQPDELLTAARRAALRVCAFEQGVLGSPRPAVIQRIVAWRNPAPERLR
ncbi:MAG: methyltransferase domain-containing protein [Lautropia sp.]|nr:methyltransferase domain-containing protein [Lautropia sp.]